MRVIFWDNRIQVWCDVLKRTDCKSLEWVDTGLLEWSVLDCCRKGCSAVRKGPESNLSTQDRGESRLYGPSKSNQLNSNMHLIYWMITKCVMIANGFLINIDATFMDASLSFRGLVSFVILIRFFLYFFTLHKETLCLCGWLWLVLLFFNNTNLTLTVTLI